MRYHVFWDPWLIGVLSVVYEMALPAALQLWHYVYNSDFERP